MAFLRFSKYVLLLGLLVVGAQAQSIRAGFTGAPWTALQACANGLYVTASPDNAHVFRAINSTTGTAGALQPTWNTAPGAITIDGTCKWRESGTAGLTGNVFATGAVLGPTTVAGLAFITPSDGMGVVVKDSASAGSCAVGGGTLRSLCIYSAGTSTWVSGGGLNCANAGIAYSDGTTGQCSPGTSLDAAGNLVGRSLTSNGPGANFSWSVDNISFAPPAGEWAMASVAGVVHLFDIAGVDYGRVLGTNACGAVTTGTVVGVLCLNGSGLALTSQLGTGTQDSTTCLHGNSTWVTCSGGGGGASPSCSLIGSSDTLTAAGTFATTCNPTLTLSTGSLIEIRAHGVYTTPAGVPLLALQVNAGGTAGLCSNTSNINPGASKTAGLWELHCYIQIATTGAPGTAYTWGRETLYNPNGGAQIGPVEWLAGPGNYTTTSAQTFSIQETATMIASQSITLQSFFVRQY